MTKRMLAQCSVNECNEIVGTGNKGMCGTHYRRQKKWGDVNMYKALRPIQIGRTVAERFWERVRLTADDDRCWEWVGSTNARGYGNVTVGTRAWLTHRFAWFLVKGYEPNLCLLHSCDNPPCVNPNHLREGTRKENAQDMIERGQMPRGERRVSAKLTDEAIRRIRALRQKGHTLRSLGTQFGVHGTTIMMICNGRHWSHVT